MCPKKYGAQAANQFLRMTESLDSYPLNILKANARNKSDCAAHISPICSTCTVLILS